MYFISTHILKKGKAEVKDASARFEAVFDRLKALKARMLLRSGGNAVENKISDGTRVQSIDVASEIKIQYSMNVKEMKEKLVRKSQELVLVPEKLLTNDLITENAITALSPRNECIYH